MAERREIEVWADWSGLGGPLLMGRLHATPTRGREVFSFEYEAAWLAAGHAGHLDPTLRLLRGPQYPAHDRPNFGVFLDSAPDRWGRVLMDRREAQLARTTGRRPRHLTELDYLLGVYDEHRMGALRYRLAGGPYLDDNRDLASPPWTSLRELEQASLRLERAGAENDPSYGRWLHMLIAPGRSLGGARPKASVVDAKHALWIAKFPSSRDVDDIGAWESVLHDLAARAGIDVPETKRRRLGSDHHTFLARRFDRSPAGRLHFASAMTLLDRTDGDTGSYLELAALLIRAGAHATRDLEELWRRIVFFICVSNVDDHLRNHGFLLEARGWSLSPLYDVNPVAYGDGLTLNISETDNAQELDLARETAAHFRIKPKRADEIIAGVTEAVRGWDGTAAKAGIPREERERMAPAFRIADRC